MCCNPPRRCRCSRLITLLLIGPRASATSFLLDLTHELTQDLSHGLTLKLTRARSGLKALARVLERWVLHMLGVQVQIEPVHQINDSAWRWHVGLDVESTAILNDLYQDRPVEAERMARTGQPVHADLCQPRRDACGCRRKAGVPGAGYQCRGAGARIKPQNLPLNLPLATVS